MKKEKKNDKKNGKRQSKPNIVYKPVSGLDLFRFWNTDTYIGNYQASAPNNLIKKG